VDVNKLIAELKHSNLLAECTLCNEEFQLSSAVIFDGLDKFPKDAEDRRNELLQELKEQTDKLKKRKVSADVGAEKKAIEVGIGKIIEKIVPTYKAFKFPLLDCRPLFEPIDFVIFNGLSTGTVSSITLLDVKTGNARLNSHQKMVRDAVSDKKLSFEVV
jgi:predicted Holliday junction resolvase-like endonuclease